jgi:hypothetical protein
VRSRSNRKSPPSGSGAEYFVVPLPIRKRPRLSILPSLENG